MPRNKCHWIFWPANINDQFLVYSSRRMGKSNKKNSFNKQRKMNSDI